MILPAWLPSAVIEEDIPCSCCGETIPRSRLTWTKTAPKAKAYWCIEIGQWECLLCRAVGARCERARAACAGCAHLVPRLLVEGVWIHQLGGGHLRTAVATPEVATFRCRFIEDEPVATPLKEAA